MRFYDYRSLGVQLLLACLLIAPAEKAYADPPEKQTETEELPELNVAWIDNFQDGVENTVDNTARWFDQFFGSDRTFDDNYDSQGRLSIGPSWSAYDGWEVKSRFRAQFRLPQAEERFSAIIGRGNFDDVLDNDQSTFEQSVLQSYADDEEWILGLGFDPKLGETNRLYFSAGIRKGLKADLYAQGRYLWQRKLNDYSQLRVRSTLFWRDSDGFGVNERLDWEASMREAWLARISVDLTLAERTDGVRWHNSAALFHLYGEERAIAGEVFIQGQTSAKVPVRDYGYRIIHRREWFREWLFLEVWAGQHWPREELEQQRKLRYMFGLEVAMWFGR